MYDLMLQLPLFQGISRDQLTAILEKTPFLFKRYRDGEVIRKAGAPCSSIIFVLSGEVRLLTPTFGGRMTIVQDFYAPHTMPFSNLFGAELTSRSTLYSIDRTTGVMMLDKPHFLRLMQQNTVLLVAVLNMLSTTAQKQLQALDFSSENDEVLRLASWLLAYTDRRSHRIFLDAKITDWCNMLHLDQAAFWRSVTALESTGSIEVANGKLKLLDRYGLHSFVVQKKADQS